MTDGICIKTPGFSSSSPVLRTKAPVILADFQQASYSSKDSSVFIFQLINQGLMRRKNIPVSLSQFSLGTIFVASVQ
jgi:hypothetical protein